MKKQILILCLLLTAPIAMAKDVTALINVVKGQIEAGQLGRACLIYERDVRPHATEKQKKEITKLFDEAGYRVGICKSKSGAKAPVIQPLKKMTHRPLNLR